MVTHKARFFGDSPAVYADIFDPPGAAKRTIVMVHGGAHTGACFAVTPDERPGWAPRFAAHGHRVVVPDWPGCGRSGTVPLENLDGALVCRGLGEVLTALEEPVVLMTHSMSGAYGWKLMETHGALVQAVGAIAPGPPANIQPAADIVARSEEMVEVERFGLRWSIPLHAARAPDDMLVNDKLIGASTRFPRAHIGAYKTSLKAIAPRLLFERQNVDGSQLRVENTAALAGKSVLIVTGSDDRDHAREVDAEVADWLIGIGADVDYWFLPEAGIDGNGHMMMLEDNSDEIAALIGAWIDALET